MFLLPKLLYISLYAILGSAIPYLPLFYDSALGLTSQQIGLVLAIAPFVQSAACPLWTVMADRHPARHGMLMAGLTLVGAVSIMSLMALPSLKENASVTSADILWITIALALVFAFFGLPVSALVDSAVLKMLGDQKILYGSQRLWGSISNGLHILVVGLLINILGIDVAFYIFAVGATVFISLSFFTRIDHATPGFKTVTESVDEEQQPLLKPQTVMRYNDTVMTSPMGDVNASPFSSSYFSALSGTSYPNPNEHPQPFRLGWNAEGEGLLPRRDSNASHANTVFLDDDQRHADLMCSPTTSMAARDAHLEADAVLSTMDHMPPLGVALSHIPTVDTSLAAFASLGQPETQAPETSTLLKPRIWTFLVMVHLLGLSFAMIAQFLFLFLRNDLGMSSSMIGWTGPIGGVAEVSTFYISKQLFDSFSVEYLMTASHIALIGRNVVYTWLVPGQFISQAIALSMQLVNGFAYALIWSTAVSQVDSFFPLDQRSMAQGILAALFSGLGFGLGCVIGGTLYEHYGSHALCHTASAIAVLSLTIFLAGQRVR